MAPVVRKLRSDISGSEDGQSVHLYKDASVSGVIMQRRKLRCVLTVLDGLARHGPYRTRSLELAAQWNAVVIADTVVAFLQRVGSGSWWTFGCH